MENSSNFKKYEKVIIFGDDEVGKTSIIKRLSGKQLDFKYEKIKGKLSFLSKITLNFSIIFIQIFFEFIKLKE